MKTKRIKAVVAWRNSDQAFFSPTKETRAAIPARCYILPDDPASYERMVEQGVEALLRLAYKNALIQCAGSCCTATHPSRVSAEDRAYYAGYVRAILRSYGITNPKKGRK